MRKTEIIFGIVAGLVGCVLAILTLMGIMPNVAGRVSPFGTIQTCAIVCIVANVFGVIGALAVRKHHVMGSIIMTVVLVLVLLFGFPWQSISAVIYIVSIVLSAVPVKSNA